MEESSRTPNPDFNPKFALQNNQYHFPYHYIPWFNENGEGKKYRVYKKGYEYLCYVKHVLGLIDQEKPRSVLEVGCGDGRIIGLLEKVEKKIGIDLSAEAIAFARAFHPEVEFLVNDASKIEGEFDIVLAVEVLEHIPDNEVSFFLKTLEDRCTKGGKVIITVPSKAKPLIEKHYRHYDENLFYNHLKIANINLKIDKIEHIFKETSLIRLYRRLTINKYWVVQLNILERYIWKKVCNNWRIVEPGEGHHLVITLSKP